VAAFLKPIVRSAYMPVAFSRVRSRTTIQTSSWIINLKTAKALKLPGATAFETGRLTDEPSQVGGATRDREGADGGVAVLTSLRQFDVCAPGM
jgi:hypothetical protein